VAMSPDELSIAGKNIFTLMSEGHVLLRILNETQGRGYASDIKSNRQAGSETR
jgi:hypothetical protein